MKILDNHSLADRSVKILPKKLNWYYNRLQTMSSRELIFRASQACQKILEKTFPVIPVYKGAIIKKTGLNFSLMDASINEKFSIFGKPLDINQNINFHYDIFSGKSFPLAFAKNIDIRTDKYGSAKVVWEINRMQFLVPLLIDYKKTGDCEKLNLFVSLITEWDKQNPYMKGINWYSNIEISKRLINWYWCWLLLEDDKAWQTLSGYEAFRNDIWLPLIYKHCCYCAKNPSYFSSANNHLVAEYSGLFIASSLWQFKESPRWLAKAKEGLEKEILLQHSEHGINKEEAAGYIQAITDFFLLAYITGQHHAIPFSTAYRKRLSAICSYIHSFLDSRGNFPRYGDDDDGRVILPDGNMETNNFISILNTASVLFDKPEWKRQDFDWDVKSQLLTSHINGKTIWASYAPKEPGTGIKNLSDFFREEGHFILKKRTPDNKEIFLHFDAASLGYLSIAAHGHADALSVILHADGYPFLVDPGTYTYHTHMDWRKYFVSTLAHNTLTIDQINQANMAGPTLWLDHFKCTVHEANSTEEKDTVTASHNGYKKKGIIHTRTIIFDKATNHFQITDTIQATKKSYQVNMPFHLHPSIDVFQTSDNSYSLSHPKTSTKLEINFDSLLKTRKIDASDNGKLGWYSSSFMKKERSSVLMGEIISDQKSLTLSTTIRLTA